MNSIQHTPAPHYAVYYANFINMQSADEYSDTDNLLDIEKCPEAEANGRLYEASPDLLRACKLLVEELKPLAKDRWNALSAIEHGEAAIKKAIKKN